MLLVTAATHTIRNRKKFFSATGHPGDRPASAHLRMWMVILTLIHAIVITPIMVFEVCRQAAYKTKIASPGPDAEVNFKN